MMMIEIGRRAKVAARAMAGASSAVKDEALAGIARALEEAADAILDANTADLERGESEGLSRALLDRLTLTPERISQIAGAVRDVIALPDPVGEVIGGTRRPNGLDIVEVRVPLGVVAMIYEARPNVTVDAAALCIKSGNACILRGSRTAIESNKALARLIRHAIVEAGLPEDAVQLVEDTSHESVAELMRMRGYVDVLIPRGGADLIRNVVEGASVPVIETGVGNCHVYVDASADVSKAIPIVINAKTHRPSVCNAAESVLVHRAVADDVMPKLLAELAARGVEVRGDDATRAYSDVVVAATDDDYRAEFLDLTISVKVVGSLDEAIEHINAYGTLHTEAIVTEDYGAAQRFAAEVDAACVMINASTRFADGGEFGLGAEIGISTQKLHARGPFALEALTTSKYVVRGSGQVRE
ncbi:MAG TPA: glutamate-5-semialdehyde dehydrogenase [Actinomycetota bacterium]